jgi:hypothetical protein
MFREDPGPCAICGAAHSACTSDSGPITMTQLPARDASLSTQPEEPPAELAPPETTTPEPAPFSTAEYDRKKHGLKRAGKDAGR